MSRTVCCQAASTSRRAAVGATLLPGLLWAAQPALALIPDEEDEELVEKAKANRRQRLAEQRTTTNEFLSSEGLTNKKLDPVQRAVYTLAKSGSQIESSDLAGAASTLSDSSWVDAFGKASQELSSTEQARSSAADLLSGLGSLRSSASQGDLKATKRQYVAVVSALQSWASSAGVAASLKGL